MILANYITLIIPFQLTFPKVKLSDKNIKEIKNNDIEEKNSKILNLKKYYRLYFLQENTNEYNIDDYCENINTNTLLEIDEENSLKNWSFNFGLYCENEYLKNYIKSINFFSCTISNLFMSIISDKFGRKFGFFFEVLGTSLSFIFLIIFGNSNLYVLFFSIFAMQLFTNLFNSSHLYLFEFFQGKFYKILFLCFTIFFSIIGIIIAFIVENFRSLVFIEMGFLMLLTSTLIFAIFYLIESPDWILSKLKKLEQKINELYVKYEKTESRNKKDSIMDEIKNLHGEFTDLKKSIINNYQNLLSWESENSREEKMR